MGPTFDLPILDDSNSIAVPEDFDPAAHESPPDSTVERVSAAVTEHLQQKETVDHDDADPIDAASFASHLRIPEPFSGSLRSYPKKTDQLDDCPSLSTYCPDVAEVCIRTMIDYTAHKKYDLTLCHNLSNRLFSPQITLSEDHCTLLDASNGVQRSETQNSWQKTLADSSVWSVHQAAQKCVPLFDIRHGAHVRNEPNADKESLWRNELSSLQACALTASHRQVAAVSVESAFCESPLANTFVSAVKSGSAVNFSPEWLRLVIDGQVQRLRGCDPLRHTLDDENGIRRTNLATICVEDSSASTGLYEVIDESESDVARSHWTEAGYYYGKTARFLAHEIVRSSHNHNWQPNADISDKTDGRPGLTHGKQNYDWADLPRRDELYWALSALPQTRTASLRDEGKAVQAERQTFFSPHCDSKDISAKAGAFLPPLEVLQLEKDSSLWSSRTIGQVAASLSNIYDERTRSSPVESAGIVDQLIQRRIEAAASERKDKKEKKVKQAFSKHWRVVSVPKGAQSLTQVTFSGADNEWRALIDRLKQQIRLSGQSLGDWLAACLWLVLHLCWSRSVANGSSAAGTTIVTKKDWVFVQARIGKEWLHCYDEHETEQQKSRAFVNHLFWHDGPHERIGGLATIFWPLETGQLMRLENVSGDALDRKLRPLHNSAMFRLFFGLVPFGVSTSQILDTRTTTGYNMISKHYRVRRGIYYGVCGYAVEQLRGDKTLTLQPVVAAFDIVEQIVAKHTLPRFPAPTKDSGDRYVDNVKIDTRLERFLAFPYRSDDGGNTTKIAVSSERRDFNSSKTVAGFGELQVGIAYASQSMDKAVHNKQFLAQLDAYEQRSSGVVLQKKAKTNAAAEKMPKTSNSVANRGAMAEKPAENLHDGKKVEKSTKKSAKTVVTTDKKEPETKTKRKKNTADHKKTRRNKKIAGQDDSSSASGTDDSPQSSGYTSPADLYFDSGFEDAEKEDRSRPHSVSQKTKKSLRSGKSPNKVFKGAKATPKSKHSHNELLVAAHEEHAKVEVSVSTDKVETASAKIQAAESTAKAQPTFAKETQQQAVEHSTLCHDQPVESGLATTGRLMGVPPFLRFDQRSVDQKLMALDAQRQQAIYLLQLAARERPMLHTNHVAYEHRVPIAPQQLEAHLRVCADGTLTVRSVYGLLLSTTDSLFGLSSASKQWTDFVSVAIGGKQNPSLLFVDRFAGAILQRVTHLAVNHGLDGALEDSVPPGSSCMLCCTRYRAQFYIVPQSIDRHNTVATRLIALCDSDECLDSLLTRMGDVLKPPAYSASLPGLRVFFRLDGAIGVYESEKDPIKLSFGNGSGACGQSFASSTDFAHIDKSVMTTDQHGNVYALPPKIAKKSFHLAAFIASDPF